MTGALASLLAIVALVVWMVTNACQPLPTERPTGRAWSDDDGQRSPGSGGAGAADSRLESAQVALDHRRHRLMLRSLRTGLGLEQWLEP